MIELQEQIIDEARTWIGTPFHHQGRIKGKRVDCIGLVEMVVRKFGLCGIDMNTVLPSEWKGYDATPDNGKLEEALKQIMNKIPYSQMSHGDVVLIRRPGDRTMAASHVAFYTKEGTVVHALNNGKIKKCSEHKYDAMMKRLTVGVYRFPELCN